jgi:hypothetical protein
MSLSEGMKDGVEVNRDIGREINSRAESGLAESDNPSVRGPSSGRRLNTCVTKQSQKPWNVWSRNERLRSGA